MKKDHQVGEGHLWPEAERAEVGSFVSGYSDRRRFRAMQD